MTITEEEWLKRHVPRKPPKSEPKPNGYIPRNWRGTAITYQADQAKQPCPKGCDGHCLRGCKNPILTQAEAEAGSLLNDALGG